MATPLAGTGTPKYYRAKKAVAVRCGDAEAAAAADQHLRVANLDRAIRAAVDAAPPLSAEQRLKLAALLVGSAQ